MVTFSPQTHDACGPESFASECREFGSTITDQHIRGDPGADTVPGLALSVVADLVESLMWRWGRARSGRNDPRCSGDVLEPAGLELIRELDFDVLVPWVARGLPYYQVTDGAATRRRIDALIADLGQRLG